MSVMSVEPVSVAEHEWLRLHQGTPRSGTRWESIWATEIAGLPLSLSVEGSGCAVRYQCAGEVEVYLTTCPVEQARVIDVLTRSAMRASVLLAA